MPNDTTVFVGLDVHKEAITVAWVGAIHTECALRFVARGVGLGRHGAGT